MSLEDLLPRARFGRFTLLISDADDTGNPPDAASEVFAGLYDDDGFQNQINGFYFPRLDRALEFSSAVAKVWKQTRADPERICRDLLASFGGKEE